MVESSINMSEDLVQGVIETIDSANQHRLHLAELLNNLDEASQQVWTIRDHSTPFSGGCSFTRRIGGGVGQCSFEKNSFAAFKAAGTAIPYCGYTEHNILDCDLLMVTYNLQPTVFEIRPVHRTMTG